MSLIDQIQKFINPGELFDWFRVRDGQFYLFHFGKFVEACDNTIELQAAQERILRGGNIYGK